MTVKKWLLLFATFLAFQSLAKADEIVTTVFNVLESKKTEKILVLSGRDGRVYRYSKSEKNLKYLKSFIGSVVKLTFIDYKNESFITNISKVNEWEVGEVEMELNYFRYHQLRTFAPSDLQSEEKVSQVFSSMINDGDKVWSQCFKRAHIWAFDMWSKLGLSSQKIFIFYTERFTLLEDFQWWFHVAPMVVANGAEYVLDSTFFDKPVTLNEWQHYFIKSDNITCPVIEKFQDYEAGHYKRLCYLMKVPMFYFSPLDIQARDKKGIERNHWELEELQDARRAFKDYEKSYEGLDTGKPTITH